MDVHGTKLVRTLFTIATGVALPRFMRSQACQTSKPRFPLQVTWRDSGATDSFATRGELLQELEDFDASDPATAAGATVTDALGRAVHLRVRIWEDLCEVRLATG